MSKTYGDALLELAMEKGTVDTWFQEAKELLTVLRANEDLAKLMNHPKIVKEEKLEIIENIFAGRLSEELVGLMCMLVAKDHFGEMESVFDYFVEEVKEYKKIGTAYVTSAVELSPEQKRRIEEKLLATTKYVAFEMNYRVDAALIGGMVIRIKDRVVDSSVRTKLQKLTSDLMKIQLKVGECAP